METVDAYQNALNPLKALDEKILAVLDHLAYQDPSFDKNAPPRHWFASLGDAFTEHSADNIMAMRAKDDVRAAFVSICKDIINLPDEYKTLVMAGLVKVQSGPGMVERWANKGSCPSPIVLPDKLKAFRYGISFILNENEEDRAFRQFYALANTLRYRASRAASGTHWKQVNVPKEPVQEYTDEMLKTKAELQGVFMRLDDRYIDLMNRRLKNYPITRFPLDMAPIDHVNTKEERSRIQKLNDEIRTEAEAYRSGAIEIRDTVQNLDSADLDVIAKLATTIAYATQIYFEETKNSLVVDFDEETGEVTSVKFPEPETPTRQ